MAKPTHYGMSYEDAVIPEIEVLYRVARRLSLNETEAEDLVGQTLLSAAKNWSSFDGRYVRSWLLRILKNAFAESLRKRRVRGEVTIEEAGDPSDEGFWKETETNLTVQTIVAALDLIPQDFRIVVTLCDIEELTYEEAARALELPLGTVRSRLHRGRKLLRAQLTGTSLDPNYSQLDLSGGFQHA